MVSRLKMAAQRIRSTGWSDGVVLIAIVGIGLLTDWWTMPSQTWTRTGVGFLEETLPGLIVVALMFGCLAYVATRPVLRRAILSGILLAVGLAFLFFEFSRSYDVSFVGPLAGVSWRFARGYRDIVHLRYSGAFGLVRWGAWIGLGALVFGPRLRRETVPRRWCAGALLGGGILIVSSAVALMFFRLLPPPLPRSWAPYGSQLETWYQVQRPLLLGRVLSLAVIGAAGATAIAAKRSRWYATPWFVLGGVLAIANSWDPFYRWLRMKTLSYFSGLPSVLPLLLIATGIVGWLYGSFGSCSLKETAHRARQFLARLNRSPWASVWVVVALLGWGLAMDQWAFPSIAFRPPPANINALHKVWYQFVWRGLILLLIPYIATRTARHRQVLVLTCIGIGMVAILFQLSLWDAGDPRFLGPLAPLSSIAGHYHAQAAVFHVHTLGLAGNLAWIGIMAWLSGFWSNRQRTPGLLPSSLLVGLAIAAVGAAAAVYLLDLIPFSKAYMSTNGARVPAAVWFNSNKWALEAHILTLTLTAAWGLTWVIARSRHWLALLWLIPAAVSAWAYVFPYSDRIVVLLRSGSRQALLITGSWNAGMMAQCLGIGVFGFLLGLWERHRSRDSLIPANGSAASQFDV